MTAGAPERDPAGRDAGEDGTTRDDDPTADAPGDDPLLAVRDLRVRFPAADGTVRAVDGVSFEVRRGETVCLVGESGSGKTVTCQSLTRLLPAAARVEGEVLLEGRDLTGLPESRLRAVRGGRIAHVFQNPQDALDPVYTVGAQVAETVRLHRDVSKAAARERAAALLDRVGIPNAPERADDYPHQFSGGMRQRVVVATALAADPDLLVADEPTTALDVTIQAQILRLLRDLKDERGLAVLFVTHDLGVVAQVADRVVVMYAGKVMERAGVAALFDAPAHPYTRALLSCLPARGRDAEPIPGRLPDPRDPPSGCRFHPRCPHAVDACRAGDQPPLRTADDAVEGGRASCVYYGPGYDPAALDGDDPAALDGDARATLGGDSSTADVPGGDDPDPGGDGP